MSQDQREARWHQLHTGADAATQGVQRAGDIPRCGRDAPARRRQQEAVHSRRRGFHGRAPVALRRHRARAATQVNLILFM